MSNIATSSSAGTLFVFSDSGNLKTRTASQTSDITAAASGSNADITSLDGLTGVSALGSAASVFATIESNALKKQELLHKLGVIYLLQFQVITVI